MSYYTDCLKKFSSLPDEFRNNIGSFENLEKIQKIESDYNIELKFLIILIAIGELEIKDIPSYLEKKSDINKRSAEEVKGKITAIFNPLAERMPRDKFFEEKLKDIFNKGFIKVLKDNDYIQALNEEILIEFFSGGEVDSKKLLKLLLNNQEKITHHEFLIEGRPHSPSIANWIKDFIKKNGSGNFDNLVLTKYITASPNVKTLGTDEKELLRKLFITYRNLAFYPDSLDNSSDELELIPTSEGLSGKLKVGKTSEIKKLQEMANEYPEGSLERKAIDEEILRLKK